MRKIFYIIISIMVVLGAFAAGVYYQRVNPVFSELSFTNTEFVDVIPNRAPIGSSVLFGNIYSFKKIGKTWQVEVSFAEWVKDQDDQEQAALADGVCTLERIEDDECLPNGFYLRKSEKTITLPIDKKILIEVLSPGPSGEIKQDESDNTILRTIDPTIFSLMVEKAKPPASPPYVIITKGGLVTEIREWYVP